MLKAVENEALREARGELSELDEIARAGARRMLMAALETEAADYVERHRHERDAEGRALVVHNGRSQGRKLTLRAGRVVLKAPRVNVAGAASKASASASPAASCPLPAAFAQGGRGAAHSLSARALHRRFPPHTQRVAGRGRRRSVANQLHTTYRLLGERIHRVSPVRSGRAPVTFTCGSMGCTSTSGSKTTCSAP
jgi:hypothetical protein